MNYLSIEKISKTYGLKTLFEDISFGIDKGNKVGLVAKNGTGKSTLLKIIAGKETPDAGEVVLRNGITVAFLDQDDSFNKDQTIKSFLYDNPKFECIKRYEELLERDPGGEAFQKAMEDMTRLNAWDTEQQIHKILNALGVKDINKNMSKLSGGEIKRIALSKVLLDEADLIILDEPTNHLDLDMIEWLEVFLAQKNLTLFMVTHDRYFLETICDEIIEIDAGTSFKYTGNFSYYLEKRAMRYEIEEQTIDKAKNLMRKELEWIRRQPKARGTKQKARVDAFDDIKELAGQKIDKSELELQVKHTRLGTKVIEFHNVNKAYKDLILLNNFSYNFKAGEKIGIVGRNGVGKSTFINMIMDKIEPDSGKIVIGDTVKFGYYEQKGMSYKEGKKVIEVVKDIAEYIPLEKGKTISASQLLEKFFFPKHMHYNLVDSLSGGEKKRLYLITILLNNPNFMILDEPTNDLDIYTIQALENFLESYGGCLIVISHDRYFIDKTCDHIFYMKGAGEIKDINGNYTSYREELLLEEEEKAAAKKKKKDPVVVEEKSSHKEKPAISNNKKQEYLKLEQKIASLEKSKKELEAKMYAGSLPNEEVLEIGEKINSLSSEIEEKTMEWMEVAELMED